MKREEGLENLFAVLRFGHGGKENGNLSGHIWDDLKQWSVAMDSVR